MAGYFDDVIKSKNEELIYKTKEPKPMNLIILIIIFYVLIMMLSKMMKVEGILF